MTALINGYSDYMLHHVVDVNRSIYTGAHRIHHPKAQCRCI
jgi:hypothetical protein